MDENSILLHCCCAHCAAYPVSYWRGQGLEVSGFWYNPNIHPYREHQLRLEAMISLAAMFALPLEINSSYDMPAYFRGVVGHEKERCRYCLELRLEKTALVAREKGFTSFSSTLLISPHQDQEELLAMGEAVAGKTGVKFAHADLRKRYSDSRHITKPLGLYRQQYCGCLYSELERYSNEGLGL